MGIQWTRKKKLKDDPLWKGVKCEKEVKDIFRYIRPNTVGLWLIMVKDWVV